jgi:ribosomal protein S18 acetylase RimI-like enzyme
MLAIASVPASPPNPMQEQARKLFRHYGEFLRVTQACGTFNFARLDEEIRTLPTFYTDLEGEVLLATVNDTPAACIAYKRTPDKPKTWEIKRLYVLPEFRGQGLARKLVTRIMEQAPAQGVSRVILDTDIVNMPGALALYGSFGFREYGMRQGNIAFFELYLS